MLEVAVAALVEQLDLFARAIEITPDLFEGLPWTEGDLRRMRGRVDWDPYLYRLPQSITHRSTKDWGTFLERLAVDEAPAKSGRSPISTTASIRGELASDAWGLSDAEANVLELLAQGHGNGEIASALGLGAAIVADHVRAMLRKASATNRTMLAYRFWTLETDGVL